MTHPAPSRPAPFTHAVPALPSEQRPAAIRRPRDAAPRDAEPAGRVNLRGGFLIVATIALVGINVAGAPYYLADQAARVRHPFHPWLKASGYVGQTAGIVAVAIFAFLWLYPLRKKWKALAFTGAIGRWLDVHVVAALLLPPLLTIHAAWRSDGLIGLGFAAMLVVWASGIVGRYLYSRIPRAKSGVAFTREEVATARRELILRLAAATGLAADDLGATLESASTAPQRRDGVLAVFAMLVTNDLHRWRLTRRIRSQWRVLAPGNRALSRRALDEAVGLASREISLSQQVRMLDATQRVFRYWHVAHRPFAVTALVAVVIHVGVVMALGVTWLR